MNYPEKMQDLIDSFMLLPGIGPKAAERLTYFVLRKLNREQVEKFGSSLIGAFDSTRKCAVCGNYTDKAICGICRDETRENTLMIVETGREVKAFEKTNRYKGKYHVLNGLISPSEGTETIDLSGLIGRIKKEKPEKVIIATSSTMSGEMTAMYIGNALKGKGPEIYRIGCGLPVGADIGYADEVTLTESLAGIKKYGS